jgi:multiple antibiotic resistance protein
MQELINGIGFGLLLILPLANPFFSVVLFLSLTKNMSKEERNVIAGKSSFYILLIMLVVYYSGQIIMHSFGISIPGLRISGGFIVALFGFKMLFPTVKNDVQNERNRPEDSDIAFIPLAMPGTAGPGTMAVIISYASTLRHDMMFSGVSIALAPPLVFMITSLLIWICLRGAGTIVNVLGQRGISAISQLMGFILISMGVQFIINGGYEVLSSWAKTM